MASKRPALLLALALTATALAPPPARALTGNVFIGTVTEADCRNNDEPGELYAAMLEDGVHSDWQAHLPAKGGGFVGMQSADFDGTTFQVLPGNFQRPESPRAVVLGLVTLARGFLFIDSETLGTGFAFAGSARKQRVGDTPPWSASAPVQRSLLILPDDLAPWTADLGRGPERFPRRVEGWPELAFAPVRELDNLWPDSCSSGGVYPDPDGSGRLLAGYNVYRLATDGRRPEREEVGQPENWVDFIELPPSPGSQAILHDPDGLEHSGDELITWHDAPFARDRSPRRHGLHPQIREPLTWWYVVQPAARGSVDEFAWTGLSGRPPEDHRRDLDGDGLFDAVELDGDDEAGGPEFVSPQAEEGAAGLGLTFGGQPLVSKLMAWDDCLVAPTTATLRVGVPTLRWSLEPGVASWTLRMSRRPEDLAEGAPAGSVEEAELEGTRFDDPGPPPGGLRCYRLVPNCGGGR